jgi:uroporphyrin-III C-methyltransferase/precorrin-2 dehydrogenase/sirohydrochlorin ferrochelatase
VGAGPGDVDLLTIRAQRLLQEADVIVHDAGIPDAVIAMGRRDAERINVRPNRSHRGACPNISTILVEQASRGRRVVRLAAGDCSFSTARQEIAALRAARIPFELVPGVGVTPVDAAEMAA